MISYNRQGIRFRLAMLYLGIFAAGLAVFCTVLFQYFQRTQLQAFDTTLYNFAVDISSNLEMDSEGRLAVVNSTLAEAGKLFPFHLGGSFLEIRNVDGTPIMHSRSLKEKSLPLDQSVMKRLANERAVFQTMRATRLGVVTTSPDLRVVSYWAHHPGWRQPLILQIAVPLDLPQREQRDLLLFFIFGIPIFLLIAGVAGIWMSRRALKPVHDMTVKAKGISGVGSLTVRIPVPEGEDEIRELAITFNGLLDRLDRAFTSQDRFVANASHQLRTPLTILKGEVDLLRKSKGSATEIQEGLGSVGDEINRLIQLVHDLLLLARLEAGRDSIEFTAVHVDDVLMRVVSRMQKLARLKDVQVKPQFGEGVEGGELEGEVLGDEELLDSMFENFIENAVKYSPNGENVDVSMTVFDESIQIQVTDSGPGIPEDLRQKIFERFSRVQPSHIVPGSGLGLAIAAEIAHLHSIKIELSEAPGSGTRVTLTLPRV